MIGELVRLRKDARLTQSDVARVVKTDQSLISKYERLERELGLIDFVRYCEAVGVKPSEPLKLLQRPKGR